MGIPILYICFAFPVAFRYFCFPPILLIKPNNTRFLNEYRVDNLYCCCLKSIYNLRMIKGVIIEWFISLCDFGCGDLVTLRFQHPSFVYKVKKWGEWDTETEASYHRPMHNPLCPGSSLTIKWCRLHMSKPWACRYNKGKFVRKNCTWVLSYFNSENFTKIWVWHLLHGFEPSEHDRPRIWIAC